MPYFDPAAMGAVIDEVMERTHALLFGRRTWQTMAAAWPGRAGDPFADRMNEIPKYVASRTLTQDDITWSGSTLLPADDAIGAVRDLRARDGKGLQVMGSASLAAQLIEHDLVDEYRLMIEPILLGAASASSRRTGRRGHSSSSRRPRPPPASSSARTARPAREEWSVPGSNRRPPACKAGALHS